MDNVVVRAIKHAATAYTYEDPVSARTARNRRNALIISGFSLLHYWNPIELTGLGFKLKNSNSESITIILICLLTYLTFTLLLNTISDILESIEKINSADVDETRKNWSIATNWAESLKEINKDGTYPADKGYVEANIKALNEKIPEVIKLEEQYRISVQRAKVARITRTIVGDIIAPFIVIGSALFTLIISLVACN